jgi:hypothetical protein
MIIPQYSALRIQHSINESAFCNLQYALPPTLTTSSSVVC